MSHWHAGFCRARSARASRVCSSHGSPGRASLLLLFIPLAVLIQHEELAGITFQGRRALAAFQARAAEGSFSSASSQAPLTKKSERRWSGPERQTCASHRKGGGQEDVISWDFANPRMLKLRATSFVISAHNPK